LRFVACVSFLCSYLYIPGSALTLYILETGGVRACLVTASVGNTAMLLVRWLVLVLPGVAPRTAFTVTLLSQAVASMFQPMSLNLIARLAGDWFPANERDLGTTLATLSNIAGQFLFSLVPPRIVRTPEQLPRVMLLQLLPSAAVTVAVMRLLRERPPSPPSAAAAQQWREREEAAQQARGNPGAAAVAKMLQDMRLLAANRNFVLLCAGFSIGTGNVWALLMLQSQVVTPCGYTDATAGVAGASLLLTGMVFMLILGRVMEQTRAYWELQRGVMVGAWIATVAVMAAEKPGDRAGLLLAWCLLGSFLQPLMPLSLEHAAEMTFPLSADVSNSALFVACNVFSSLFTVLLAPMLQAAHCDRPLTPAAALTVACMTAGVALTWGVRRDYRRSAAEEGRGSGEETRRGAPLLGRTGSEPSIQRYNSTAVI
jgi:FLVCR family MFS transporter 7